ncbi:TPA: zinc-binding alcohol dehydrogenase [Candidatus Poribacteria bacterium]|nr:zinc-binding alcohol dehydrogenase [Candidatus Poribacteria bacterium]HIN27969.1 zinc-binding alcohol dehydrogenase [Candidatus Poribacteria bacterium]
MPRELVAVAPRTPVLREYEEQPLKSNELRIKSIFSAPKHGTELRPYRADTKDQTSPFDGQKRIHIGEGGDPKFPIRLGNMAVGNVIEVGQEVASSQIGDKVFGHLPIRETHTVNQGRIKKVPKGMSSEAIVYSDPAGVALCAIQGSQICLGSSVIIFGLGAIGQMALQLARLQGARWIAVSDPIPVRRKVAKNHGADLVIDPTMDDVGFIVKDQTENAGVDVSIETSGSYAAMNDALRATAYGGKIVSAAYYTGDSSVLSFEGEWHRNQLTIISTRDVNSTLRDHPLWNTPRLHTEAFALLQEDRISVDGLVHPIVPFSQAAEAYRVIDEKPAESIKLGIVADDQ